MLAHFPDRKTKAQCLQLFAQSPKACQWWCLSVWLVLEKLCFLCLLLLYIFNVPRKDTERGSLRSINARPYVELKTLQCIELKTMEWIERVLTKGNGMASMFVYFVYICLFLSVTFSSDS